MISIKLQSDVNELISWCSAKNKVLIIKTFRKRVHVCRVFDLGKCALGF